MASRRASLRLELSFPVLVESGGDVRRLVAVNVSESGMMFVSPETYQVGQPLRITFGLPWTDVELVARAEVRHVVWLGSQGGSSAFAVGVRFDGFEQGELHPPIRCLPC